MASNKRKQDEKHLKILREFVTLPHNKQCFDCHQRGPTYVNMTIGSFVCTSCSGLLRGLNPPHRVKSISMTSFTPEEMEFLKCHGNQKGYMEFIQNKQRDTSGKTLQFCKHVWLGLHNSHAFPEPDSKDDSKIKDFMAQKYEKKRWYVAPTDEMKEEAKRHNEPLKQEAKPLKSLIGNNVPQLVINQQQTKPSTGTSSVSVPPPIIQATSRPTNTQPQAPPPLTSAPPSTEKKPSGLDLLGDLGGDPFAGPPAAQNTAVSSGGFADFSAFNGTSSGGGGGGFANFGEMNQPVQMPSQPLPAQPAFPPPAAAALLNPLSSQPVSSAPSAGTGGFGDFTTASISSATTSSTGSASDKYAALADLDSVFGTAGGSTQAVNWDGSSGSTGGGNISWSSTGTSSINSGGGGGNWNSPVCGVGTTPSMSSGTNSTKQIWYGAQGDYSAKSPVSSNPFKSIRRPVPNPFGGSSSGTVANPFAGGGVGGAGGGFAQNQFAQFGQASTVGGSTAVSSAAGFGQFGAPATTGAPTAAGGGFGQFGAPATTGAPTAAGGGFGQFGAPATTGAPTAAGGGFGQFGAPATTGAPTAAGGGFGQFPMGANLQNGGGGLFGGQGQAGGMWGGAQPTPGATGAGFGAQPTPGATGAGFGMIPASQPQMNAFPGAGMNFGAAGSQFGKQAAAPAFGLQQQQPPQQQPQQQPASFGGWNQQPAANPFMSAGQQQAVPPRGSSTNPFL